MKSQPRASTVMRQLAALQAKHGKDRSLVRRMPDLSVEQRTAPLGNCLHGSCAAKPPIQGAKQFTVSHLPKQGYQLITREDVPYLASKRNI